MFSVARVAHVALECYGLWLFRAEATPLSIVVPTMMRVTHMVLKVCPLIPSASLAVCQGLGAFA
jgi:hypothetical protein